MIKVENVSVYNLARAVYSARNALGSWGKSDSDLEHDVLGESDLGLARKLVRAGSPHRKWMRQVFVTMDITTNHTVWQQLDTYKVSTVRNSCSKMHTIHKKPFEMSDFSHEGLTDLEQDIVLESMINVLNELREKFIETNDRRYWRAMIDILPMGYNIKATLTLNYEVVLNIILQRRGHKMKEWDVLCDALMGLPYMEQFVEVAR